MSSMDEILDEDDGCINLTMLPCPDLPDFALAYQTISVIEDRSYADPNLHEVYVELEDDPDYSISTWGKYLGDVAHAIAEQYADRFTGGDMAKALSDIRDGLLSEVSKWEDEIRAAREAKQKETTAHN